MDATINALGQLLLRALPTFFLVLILHFFLKAMFFQPLARTLAQRREATEGAREAARASLDRAEKAAAEYEHKIRGARNEIYKEQEEVRRRWRDDQAEQVRAARERAEAMVKDAKSKLGAEAAEAKRALAGESAALAAQITSNILRGRAA